MSVPAPWKHTEAPWPGPPSPAAPIASARCRLCGLRSLSRDGRRRWAPEADHEAHHQEAPPKPPGFPDARGAGEHREVPGSSPCGLSSWPAGPHLKELQANCLACSSCQRPVCQLLGLHANCLACMPTAWPAGQLLGMQLMGSARSSYPAYIRTC